MAGVNQQTFLLQKDTMHICPTKVTPVELNTNLLNTIFQFNPRSKLKRFLVRKTGSEKTYYSLAEILTSLKQIIRKEGMFDQANPSVIICSTDLERALDMKALHVTEIRDLVLLQITKAPDQKLGESFIQQIGKCSGIPISIFRTNLDLDTTKNQDQQQTQQQPTAPPRIIRTANISMTTYTDKYAKFTLKPKLLKVLQLVPGTNPKQTVFSYEEITQLLSKYIISRKNDIFDPRNIRLALVADDPIGEAFGVKGFHRCQVNNLLRRQLIPVNPDSPPELAIVTQNNGSSGLNVMVTEVHTPITSASSPKPSNSKKQCHQTHAKDLSPPAISPNSKGQKKTTKKKNRSGEEESQQSHAKQSRKRKLAQNN